MKDSQFYTIVALLCYILADVSQESIASTAYNIIGIILMIVAIYKGCNENKEPN